MPRKTFRRLMAYSLSGHSHFVWLSAFALVATVWMHVWSRYGERVKSFILS